MAPNGFCAEPARGDRVTARERGSPCARRVKRRLWAAARESPCPRRVKRRLGRRSTASPCAERRIRHRTPRSQRCSGTPVMPPAAVCPAGRSEYRRRVVDCGVAGHCRFSGSAIARSLSCTTAEWSADRRSARPAGNRSSGESNWRGQPAGRILNRAWLRPPRADRRAAAFAARPEGCSDRPCRASRSPRAP